jgi:hypothetical protein
MRLDSICDVAIAGEGPVGITLACTIKALNKNASVWVFDKRTKNENHTVRVDENFVSGILSIFDDALASKNSNEKNLDFIKDLKSTFDNWKNSIIRNDEIERILSKKAVENGVTIARGKVYTLNKQSFSDSDPENLVQKIMGCAKLVIGADNSHNDVKKILFADEECAKKHLNAYVLLAGNAETSNAPLCTQAVIAFLARKEPLGDEMPAEFASYQEHMQPILKTSAFDDVQSPSVSNEPAPTAGMISSIFSYTGSYFSKAV